MQPNGTWVPTRAAVLWLAAVVAWGQTAGFEAASVRVVDRANRPAFGNHGGPGTDDPGRIHLCCVGMFSLLMRAYDVEIDRIDAPSWVMDNMGANLYQLDATMPAETTREHFQGMMQRLLEERFHLEMHREKRNFPGYELVVAEGGAKLKEAKAEAGVTAPPMRTSLGHGMVMVQAQEKPIGELVKGLGRLIAQSLGEDPNDFTSRKPRVVDKTGLTGKYDFTLQFACDGCQFAAANGAAFGPANAGETSSGLPGIFVAVQKQLGLRLVKTKDIALDVIVVDRVEKVPTAN